MVKRGGIRDTLFLWLAKRPWPFGIFPCRDTRLPLVRARARAYGAKGFILRNVWCTGRNGITYEDVKSRTDTCPCQTYCTSLLGKIVVQLIITHRAPTHAYAHAFKVKPHVDGRLENGRKTEHSNHYRSTVMRITTTINANEEKNPYCSTTRTDECDYFVVHRLIDYVSALKRTAEQPRWYHGFRFWRDT
jgi:hypothetical protein